MKNQRLGIVLAMFFACCAFVQSQSALATRSVIFAWSNGL